MKRVFDMRVMTVPRAIRETQEWGGNWSDGPAFCSMCKARLRRALIVTEGEYPQWWGICLPCVEQMAEAVEDA